MPLKYQDYPLSATFYGTFFRFFPHAHVGLKAAAGGDEEVGVLGELVSAQHAVVFFLVTCLVAHGCHLSINIRIIMCQVLPNHAAYMGSWNEVIAGLLSSHLSALSAAVCKFSVINH
jgi:hypothetical protein